MFSRRQPREVYRVYGEDEFFAEDSQHFGEQPQSMTATTPRGPSEELRAHESAHLGPDIFEEYDTVARGTPIAQQEGQLSEPWASANLPASEPDDDRYEPQAQFSPRVATQPGARRRRSLAVAALAAGLGLLVGLIAVSSLRSGHSQSLSEPPSSQARIPTVATAPAQPRARRHVDAASRPRPSQRPADREPRSAPAHSASRHQNHRDVGVARAPNNSQATRGQPEIPVDAPPPTYVPPTYASPPPSGGTEFGFEN